MADIKISALPGASTLTGAETIPLVQGGTTKKVTTDQFLIKDASGDFTTANGRINLLTVGRGGGGVASNTASGASALNANTTGVNNTASGYAALNANTTGINNTANGYAALYTNTTGDGNTANGYATLYTNTTGGYNTASGRQALYYNTTGINNTASGVYALHSNTTGVNNTASGASALYANTTGSGNTASGRSGYNPDDDIAQYRITTDFDMTLVGYGATKNNVGQLWNSTAIGARAKVTKSNQVVLGDSNVTETLVNGSLVQRVSTTAATLDTNGTLTFSVVNDTTLRISVRGSDGTTRTATVALS